MADRLPIIWLTGNSGAGKTTLAFGVRDHFDSQAAYGSRFFRRILVLDGDEMRSTVSTEEGYSPGDRRKHNLKVARLAGLFSRHGFLVIVAVIAPFEKVREEISSICRPKWIYLKRAGLEKPDRPYEPPSNPDFTIDNDRLSIEEARKSLMAYIHTIHSVTTPDNPRCGCLWPNLRIS